MSPIHRHRLETQKCARKLGVQKDIVQLTFSEDLQRSPHMKLEHPGLASQFISSDLRYLEAVIICTRLRKLTL